MVPTPVRSPEREAFAAGRTFRFDRMEWAGALGDLGTLIPFVAAYVALAGVPPMGMLLGFGLAYVGVGLFYRTPVPVQPMKAIGAVAATGAAATTVTPEAIYVATLATGVLWLALGLTGTVQWVARVVGRPVVVGIVLGLGFAFIVDGARMMSEGWWVGGLALAGSLLLLGSRAFPAMFFLLAFGSAVALFQRPELMSELATVRPHAALPGWSLSGVTWDSAFVGVVLLALPQVPLTLGNAIVGVTEAHNRLFPQRRLTESRVAMSTGAMNVLASSIGGVPMCHGAGGLAAHYRFGARTGTAPVALGLTLVVVALFFSGSIATFLPLFPRPVLGVMLFLAGAQLALGWCDLGKDKGERFVSLATAGIAIFHVGAAFLFGLTALAACRRGWLRP
jgi:MFS superfamily sulfate permease-like transporter